MADYKFKEDDDWFSPNLAEWQRFLLPLDGQPCRLLEIGSYQGRSSFWMADNLMSDPASRLICIDSWVIDNKWGREGRKSFAHNLSVCPRRAQVNMLTGESATILPTLTRGFDFAYIDGSHEASDVITDWVLVRRLMKEGGLICFDDYEWNDKSVRRPPGPAIDSILDFWAGTMKVMHKGYQVWVRV